MTTARKPSQRTHRRTVHSEHCQRCMRSDFVRNGGVIISGARERRAGVSFALRGQGRQSWRNPPNRATKPTPYRRGLSVCYAAKVRFVSRAQTSSGSHAAMRRLTPPLVQTGYVFLAIHTQHSRPGCIQPLPPNQPVQRMSFCASLADILHLDGCRRTCDGGMLACRSSLTFLVRHCLDVFTNYS